MSSDGAHDGLDAVAGMREAMGGTRPATAVERTPEEMRLFLLAAPDPPFDSSDAGYMDASRWVGKQTLAAFDAHPELVDLPMETDYDWDGDPDHGMNGMKAEFVRRPSVTHEMERLGFSLKGHGFSGFMVGWGVNAARYCVGAGDAGNPAIMEIES